MGDSSSGDSSSSKSLMWMMIAMFVGLGVLLGGGLLLANRMVRTLGLSASSNHRQTVHTPAGSFRLEKETEVGPGLPVYPHGSMELPSGSGAANAVKEAKNGVYLVVYHTNDTRDFVDDWYMKHLGPEFLRHDAGEKPPSDIFKDIYVADSDIAFSAERGQQVRVVALSQDAAGTKISLIRMDQPGPGPQQ
jgi:hypothetical protein